MNRSEVIIARSLFLSRVRSFFLWGGFLEVDTPLLVPWVPSEAHITPLTVTLQRRKGAERRYLPTSPEGALKILLAEVGRDLFEIGHSFRDGEEEGPLHRSHFRLLEWYRLEAGLDEIEADLIGLLDSLRRWLTSGEEGAAPGAMRPPVLGNPAPALLAQRCERLSVPEAFRRHLDYPIEGPDAIEGLPALAERCGHKGVSDWREAFHRLLAVEIQPKLGLTAPTILTHYPAGIAAQARPNPERPWLAEQLELFVAGVELANCYSELTDPDLQRRRFEQEAERAEGRSPPPPDERFLMSLRRLPARTAGGCLGLERLMMLWLGVQEIGALRPTV